MQCLNAWTGAPLSALVEARLKQGRGEIAAREAGFRQARSLPCVEPLITERTPRSAPQSERGSEWRFVDCPSISADGGTVRLAA